MQSRVEQLCRNIESKARILIMVPHHLRKFFQILYTEESALLIAIQT